MRRPMPEADVRALPVAATDAMANATVDATAAADMQPGPALDALRRQGAAVYDPVGLHYLEQLAARALTQPAAVQRLLLARLEPALAALQARLAQARDEARSTLDRVASEQPQDSAALQALFNAGDFKGLQRRALQAPKCDAALSLGSLARSPSASVAEPAHLAWSVSNNRPPELKAVRQFRNTWSKLSADQQLARALDQAPQNAGPINSHAVVLRSLAMMRDISPDYLNRFVSYVDTLLCLDHDAPSASKTSVEGETSKKTRTRRAAPR